MTKRESRARMKLIQEWHMNKTQQKNMDRNVKLFRMSYVRVYEIKRARRAADEALAAAGKALVAVTSAAGIAAARFAEILQRIAKEATP